MRNISQLMAGLALIPLGLTTAAPANTAARASAAAPANTAAHVAISGSGSSYAGVAIDQWSQDLRPNGIVVNYNPDGSPAGLDDYSANQDDFAVSDVPYRTSTDKLAGLPPQHPAVGFSYLPAVAGGTALLYHLTVHGKHISNLRLSEQTLMEIFTGKITNWDDPRITHDYGTQLPSLRIIPVLHSDVAGSTFYFTSWLASVFATEWNAFCGTVHPGIKPPCGPTEVYPLFGNAKTENGSGNVASYIAASSSNGAIGYDEYLYGVFDRVPVLELQNPAGDYVLPSSLDVMTALKAALINENPNSPHFLQEDLVPVYQDKNPGSYPLSNYSYFIVPRTGTRLPVNFTKAKGKTLSLFTEFGLCSGQRMASLLGYAPLPPNLTAGGLLEIKQIPGHVAVPARCPR